jgi:long-chain acyl-CoA synthetase
MSPAAAVLPRAQPTVVQMLAAAAIAAPKTEALVFGERRLDYAGYLACVAAFARELQLLGAARGPVATLMGNSIDACIAALASLAAGAQQVPLNPLYTAYELTAIFEDAAPTVLIVDAALAAMAEPVARAAGVVHVMVVGEGARRLDEQRSGDATLPPAPSTESLALLQYTGGTTGRPKGVELTHGAIAVNVAQREALLPTRSGDRILCMMPLSHAYAMAMGLFLALNCAGTLVILPRYQPEEVFAAVARERIAVFLGSPTIFVGLLAHPGFSASDWHTVHTCYSGSAALPAATLARWREAVGAPVYEGYGQTEAGPVLSFNPVRGPVKAGSVGVAVPLTEIEVVDVETGHQVLPPGICGEIRARGPQLMRGYRNRPEETALALRGGWLYTGDIGEFDADGYLYIRDRKKDMVIVGGYNVYPREVEEVLFAHPDVADAAVVGKPDAYRGEILVAHVVSRPGAKPDEEALLAHCRERLAKYKLPAQWHFSAALPKTLANKTDKNALRKSSA